MLAPLGTCSPSQGVQKGFLLLSRDKIRGLPQRATEVDRSSLGERSSALGEQLRNVHPPSVKCEMVGDCPLCCLGLWQKGKGN